MELEIQKYLRSGQSIQELIWDFDLQTYDSENYPELISFDYSIISPKEEKIVSCIDEAKPKPSIFDLFKE